MKYLFLSLVVVFAQGSWAQIDRKGNGGDLCELRIQTVRDDIAAWIFGGGSKGLVLPSGVTVSQYETLMLSQIKTAMVSCVSEKLKVGLSEKTCLNFVDPAGQARIYCNTERFMRSNDSDQYVLIHHEYAGLAELENNITEQSRYPISSQISGYLENQETKRLVINPTPPASPRPPKSCPDVTGNFVGRCIETNCNGRRNVDYKMDIKQNGCGSVNIFGAFLTKVLPIGVPVDQGNDLNNYKMRTTATYFGSALYITQVFSRDLNDASWRSAESWEKKIVGGKEVLIGKYEMTGASCGDTTMTCELDRMDVPPPPPTTNFHGAWRGPGTIFPNPIANQPNPYDVTISFTENGKTLTWDERWKLKDGHLSGGGLVYDIDGVNISYKGANVGTYSRDEINIRYDINLIDPKSPAGRRVLEYQFKILPDGKLDYRHKGTDSSGVSSKEVLGMRR